jgi:signal transduction histidine kinase
LYIAVADIGCGIAADKHGFIFEPFTQADGSTTRQYGGTGLGLAISTRLLKLMQGRICGDCAPSQGNTFHVVLPLLETDRIEMAHRELTLAQRACK